MNGNEALGVAALWAQADAVGKSALLLMLGMSVATWYLVAVKTLQHVGLARRTRAFMDVFWRAPTVQEVERTLQAQPPAEPFGRVAQRALAAARHLLAHGGRDGTDADTTGEFVARALRRSMSEDRAALESGLPVLATIGAVAPFVGLFGTVWGVFHALQAIGLAGQGTLDKVAGPVGEALVMTAIGLAVAIPAVVGYNAFVRRNRVLMHRLDAFANDVHTLVLTGAPVHDDLAVGRDPRVALPGAPRAAEG